jgi:hypothetical protein
MSSEVVFDSAHEVRAYVTQRIADCESLDPAHFDVQAMAAAVAGWRGGRLVLLPEYEDDDAGRGQVAFWNLADRMWAA